MRSLAFDAAMPAARADPPDQSMERCVGVDYSFPPSLERSLRAVLIFCKIFPSVQVRPVLYAGIKNAEDVPAMMIQVCTA